MPAKDTLHHPARPPKFYILQALFLLQSAVESEAVRFHQGCYDKHPVFCEVKVTSFAEINFDLQEVCSRIESEVFQHIQYVIQNPYTHEPYLNGVEPQSELCSQIEQAYSHCSFCGGSAAEEGGNSLLYQTSCLEDAFLTNCGGQPTQEEVLLDNENYPLFQTKQDIDETCQELINLYNISAFGFPMHHPKTIELCERQRQVKHLCEGYCKGGCFDNKKHPPSCDDNLSMDALDASNITWQGMCQAMRWQVFSPLSNEEVMDLSLHVEYLQAVSYDHPLCAAFREAYSRCFWCKDSSTMCFDTSNPPSCDAPVFDESDLDDYDEEEVYRICRDIFESLPLVHRPKNIFDVQWQTNFLNILEDAPLCDEARKVYHRCIWCEVDADETPCLQPGLRSCHLDPPVPESAINRIKAALNISEEVPTMEECSGKVLDYWVDHEVGIPVTRDSCNVYLAVRKICPDFFCQDNPKTDAIDKHNYLGTSSTLERKALIWASRFSAILSFIGASYIIYDVLSNSQSRNTVYHGLLLGMATFDLVTAAAWLFSTAPIDKEQGGHIEMASGNEATCIAQAFVIQLGFTSVFYNVSLALYYVLVIAYSWKEFQLKKIQVFLHAIPLIVGLGLALGAIPSYEVFEYGCHLLPPPKGELWPVLVFVVLPLGLSIVFITTCMIVVYLKVRERTAASKKWSLGIGQASAMEQAVFWQCLFYVMAFYVTWPIMFSVYLASVDIDGPLGLTLTVAFVAPLQGLNNALVYIRPRVQRLLNGHSSESGRSSFFARVYTKIRTGARRSPVGGGNEEDFPSAALARSPLREEPMIEALENTESTFLEGQPVIELAVVT